MVVPIFFMLFAATIELAAYCVSGHLFLLSSFNGERTAEVTSHLFGGSGGSSMHLYWSLEDEQTVSQAANQFIPLTTTLTPTTNFGFDIEQFPLAQQGHIKTEHTYQPVTESIFLGHQVMTEERDVVLFPSYRRHPLEDNCLPGAC